MLLAFFNAVSIPFLSSGFDHALNSLHLGHLRNAAILYRVREQGLGGSAGVYIYHFRTAYNIFLNLYKLCVYRIVLLVHWPLDRKLDLEIFSNGVLQVILI